MGIQAFVAIASVGLQIAGVVSAREGVADQRKANALTARRNSLQVARERKQAIRRSIALKAEARANAQGQGGAGSSGFFGSAGSLASQTGSNVGFGQQLSGINTQITSLMGSAQAKQDMASLYGGLGRSLPGMVDTVVSLFPKKEDE